MNATDRRFTPLCLVTLVAVDIVDRKRPDWLILPPTEERKEIHLIMCAVNNYVWYSLQLTLWHLLAPFPSRETNCSASRLTPYTVQSMLSFLCWTLLCVKVKIGYLVQITSGSTVHSIYIWTCGVNKWCPSEIISLMDADALPLAWRAERNAFNNYVCNNPVLLNY